MTKFAVIDTETSGLFDFSKPADADGQPRLAHLAMILLDADFSVERTIDLFVKPDGWEMVAGGEAARVNGLTTEYLNERGVPVVEALAAYAQVIDDGYVIAAFNAQYDTKVMRGEMRRAGIDDRFERTPNVCVMRALTDICQVPRKTGRGFKFPKLAEACAHFEMTNEAEHTASGDAQACLSLLLKLRDLGALPDAAVHYAKNPPAKTEQPAAESAT
jgi:DNA polymerase III epsilon subunit-like protein